MPYGPVRESPKERALSNAEREQRIKELQSEQARTLREGLGDELYDWCDAFLESGDILPDDRLTESSDK